MKIVFATATTSVAMPGGWSLRVQAGSHWSSEDPVVLAHPGLFSDDPRYGMSYSSAEMQMRVEAPVETATAGPGELRRTRRGE